MSLGHGASIVKNGLVRHVDFSNVKSYPGSGNTLFDLTQTFDNTINGGTYGVYDGVPSMDFDGTYGSVGRIEGGTIGITDSSFTVDVWCRTTDDDRANGTQGRVIASSYDYQGSSVTQDTGWLLGTIWVGTYFRFQVHAGDGSYSYAVLPDGFYTTYLNTWTNLTGVFAAGNSVKIYQNGELVDSVATTITTLGEQNDQLMWARRSAEAQSNWKGQFSAGKYYNRALTDAEVKQNFEALRGRYGI